MADLWDEFDQAAKPVKVKGGLWDEFDAPSFAGVQGGFAGGTEDYNPDAIEAATAAAVAANPLPTATAPAADPIRGGDFFSAITAPLRGNPLAAVRGLVDRGADFVRGIADADLFDAIQRGTVDMAASGIQAGGDFIDRTVQQSNPLRTLGEMAGADVSGLRDPLGVRAAADQAAAVNAELTADRNAVMAELPRPSITDFFTDPADATRRVGERLATQGTESVPAFALALASRSPELGARLLGGVSGVQDYADLTGDGVDPRTAIEAAALSAAVEAAGEGFSLPKVMAKGPVGGLLDAMLVEGGQELPVSIAQTNIQDQATGQSTPIAEQLLQGLEAAASGAGLGLGGYAASNVPGWVAGRESAPSNEVAPTPANIVQAMAEAAPAPQLHYGPPPKAEPIPNATGVAPVVPLAQPAPLDTQDDADLEAALVRNLLGDDIAAALAPSPATPPAPSQTADAAPSAPGGVAATNLTDWIGGPNVQRAPVAPQRADTVTVQPYQPQVSPQPGTAPTPVSADPAAPSAVTATDKAEGQPTPKPKRVRKVDPTSRKPMDLLQVLAATGGLNREAFRKQGVDPAEFQRRYGINYLFRKNGGRTLSELREFMQQEGYLQRDDEFSPATVDDNDALDLFDRAFRGGEEVYSLDQEQDVAAYRAARKQADDEFQAELAGDPEFITPTGDPDEDARLFNEMLAHDSNSPYMQEVSRLTERAYDLGADDGQIIDAVWDSDHLFALRQLVARLENENDVLPGAEAGDSPRGPEPRQEAEPAAGFSLQGQFQDAAPARQEVAPQAGLFGAPTGRDYLDAAQRDKDAARDGRSATGRTDMAAGDGSLFAGPAPAQAEIASTGFDSAKFDADRDAAIAASREAGNRHLDDEKFPAVETMRGKAIYYVHDPKVRGVIRTVDNRGNVYVDWSDKYSADKEMAAETREGKKVVFRSSLGPRDFKDYVFAGNRPAQARVDDVSQRPPPEPRKTASWVLREKATGRVIAETFDRKKVDALNTERYEAVPVQQHLAEINDPTTLAYRVARGDGPSRTERITMRRAESRGGDTEVDAIRVGDTLTIKNGIGYSTVRQNEDGTYTVSSGAELAATPEEAVERAQRAAERSRRVAQEREAANNGTRLDKVLYALNDHPEKAVGMLSDDEVLAVAKAIGRKRGKNQSVLALRERISEGPRAETIAKLRPAIQSVLSTDRQPTSEGLDQFAGENAATADQYTLARARDLIAKGRDPDSVRRETGWFTGHDGRWRYEISDEDAKWGGAQEPDLDALAREIAPMIQEEGSDDRGIYAAKWVSGEGDGDWLRAFGRTKSEAFASVVRAVARKRGLYGNGWDGKMGPDESHSLGDVLAHPKLYAAYPKLRDYTVTFVAPTDVRGSFNPNWNTIEVGIVADKDAMLSTLLHEVQHAIQHIEGFATGGNTEDSFVNSIRARLNFVTTEAREKLAGWVHGNERAIIDAEMAAQKYRHALMWESAQRLLDYSERDTPSGVFRLIRNETQWVYEPELRDNEGVRDFQYLFYGIPKRGPKRNAAIREIAHEGARLILAAIPADVRAEFKADTRKVRSMIDALARQRRKADKALDEKRAIEREVSALSEVQEGHKYSTAYDIYRHLAGEVEARNTQARQGLTDEQRRNTAPSQTQDVDTSKVIVVYGGMEVRAPQRMAQLDQDVSEVDADTLTPAERAAFGLDDRTASLRAAVDAALGPVASQVQYLRSWRDLPAGRLRSGVESRLKQRGGEGQTAALFDPKTGDVYLFTDANPSPERAVFNVLHEVAGHKGLRAFLGKDLDKALDLAAQNPTVMAVAEAIALERGIDASTDAGQRLAVEEALAELAAAVRTGNYDLIADRYGVTVPSGIRERVAAAVANFLLRLKALLDGKFGQTFTDADVRALLENAWQAAQGNTDTAGDPAEATAQDQTQTAAFRRWFGDSKVVDENGEPRVVYHGTKRDFDTFDMTAEANGGFWPSGALGAFFSPKDWAAEIYGPKIKPVYLKIENPYRMTNEENGRIASRDAARARREELIAERYDGIIIGAEQEFVAFRPEQIKSATANRGTFDPDSPSILESVAEGLPPNATGRSILADGRLLTLIDAAKAAGIDLADLRAAHANKDVTAAMAAIDAILAKLRPVRTTGLKNAVTDAERAAANRHPILREAVKSNEATLYEAMRTVAQDPLAGREATERLARGGVEGISLADEAVLLVHKTELLNKRDAAAKKLADPTASEDAKAVARQAWEEAEAEIAAVDMAAVNAGREWGRFGQFRQRMLRADFTFEALERKERARLERPLTAEESATILAMAKTIADLQAKVDALQTRMANAASESAYEGLAREMARAPKARKSVEYLRQAANDARARLKAAQSVPSRRGQSGAIMSPAVFYDYAVIGAYHIANGAAKFADWVDAMRADLGDVFDRIKAEHPNIFRAAQKELDKPLKADASVAEVLEKIDPANLKPSDVRKLAKAHIGEGVRGEVALIEAMAADLGLAADEVRTLFVQSDTRREPTMDEAKAELASLRKYIALQNEIDRLEAGVPKPPRAAPRPDSPAVAAKKQELADLRKSLRPVRDPEGRYQELRGKQIQKRIDELRDRIARGDFAARPRIPRALNEANQRAQFELEKAKHDFLRHQFEDNLRRRTPIGKVFGAVGDTFNLARAMMTSFDLSAILRQGGFISYGHPLRALSSVGPSLRAFASEQAEHRVKTEIESRPNAPLYKKYGLQLTGIGAGPLTQIEEAYASRWLDKFPAWLGGGMVRGSGRAYTAFLNKLRADSFDAMAAALGKRATLTEAEGKAIASYINVATGRGKIGTKENAAQTLNTVFFAPRLVASRFQLLVGQPLYGGNARTRKMIAVEYARFLIGVSIATSLAAFGFGDDDDEDKPLVGLDPRSADFGKVRVGNTYLDPLSGLAQVTTLVSRLATGETVSGSGAVKPLRPEYTLTDLRRALGADIPAHELGKDGKLPFGGSSAASVIGRFIRTKLAPVPGAIVNTLAGTNLIGERMNPAEAGVQLVVPMSFQNIGDVMEEHGIPKGAAITVLGLLGMGVQHRLESNAQQFADFNEGLKAVQADVKDRLAALPVEQWPTALEAMKKEYGGPMAGVELEFYQADGKYGLAGEPKRDKDGKPVLTSNRLADDYRDALRDSLMASGLSESEADAAMQGKQVHHVIPDNLARHHPLMAYARTLGYNLDAPSNLIAMTGAKANGEIAHKTSHPEYDAMVFGALNDAEKRLKKAHGSLQAAPKPAVLEEVRKIEAAMRQKIERKDVPTKDGRLAALDEDTDAAA